MISVCIATYNGEKYIKKQLESILSQLETSDEVVVSDDNSTDNTLKIIQSFDDKRIKIYTNKGLRGYSSNFENALAKANGEYILLSDQDDVWLPDKVDTIIKDLLKYDFVVTDAIVVNDNLETLIPSHFNHAHTKRGLLNNFLKTRYIGACMGFKKKILEKALPFPKNKKLCPHDYWLTLIAETYFSVYMEKTPCILYRRHSGTVTNGGVGRSTCSITNKIVRRLYCIYWLIRQMQIEI